MKNTALVAGAGGFIGGHLCQRLREEGLYVRGVDIKPFSEWFQLNCDEALEVCDLRFRENAMAATSGMQYVFNFAADMGGMGFIEHHKLDCMLSVLINAHLLQAAYDFRVSSYVFASTACVYAAGKQLDPNNPGLKEEDAYPAMPEDGYGWEKLFSERLCRHYVEDRELSCRVIRLHNVYGPNGTYDGGREKAPAAICRKVIQAKATGGKLEIWGDGQQTRSFMYIDDCLEGIVRIWKNGYGLPINLGSAEMVTINQLADMAEDIGGVKLERVYNPGAPTGVRGRCSDNTLIKQVLGWEPSTPLRTGLEKTYRWIESRLSLPGSTPPPAPSQP